jgi:hypothetical protein
MNMQNTSQHGVHSDVNPPHTPNGTAGTTREERNLREERNDSPTRSLGHLFAELWRDTTLLVQQEAELAKADVSDRMHQALAASGAIAGGAAIVFVGLIALMLAGVNALLPFLPPELAPWLSPLIVGIVVMVIGFILFSRGRSDLRVRNLAPSRSVESLRRDRRLVKEHLQ